MYGSYGGLAFRWMPGCFDETSLSDGFVMQHRRYHNVVAGGYTFDFAGQAVELRTQSSGFAAVRGIRVDSDNHFTKLGASSFGLRCVHCYYTVYSIVVYSLSARGRRSFDIDAAASPASVGTLVSSRAVLSYVRLGVCNKP
jgi:hypothetical protein